MRRNSTPEPWADKRMTAPVFHSFRYSGKKAVLVVKRGAGRGAAFMIGNQRVMVGRDYRVADLVTPDPSVSREHFLLRPVKNSFVLIDLASTNGTFLNNKRIKSPVRLLDGDVIRAGETVFLFKSLL